jgi:hypothetical protein
MKRLDLIIGFCEKMTNMQVKGSAEALVAARELRDMKPVAWMWKDGTITTDPDRADGTWTKLYALGDEK